jgi:hypothetical protein
LERLPEKSITQLSLDSDSGPGLMWTGPRSVPSGISLAKEILKADIQAREAIWQGLVLEGAFNDETVHIGVEGGYGHDDAEAPHISDRAAREGSPPKCPFTRRGNEGSATRERGSF